MATQSSQDFLRGDVRGQIRTLAIAGGVLLAVVAVALTATWVIYPKAKAPSGTVVHLVVPALGPGIKKGASVLLRGTQVGEVTRVQSPTPGSVNVDLVLTDDRTRRLLTDSFDVDFRPENYFGITAVNLIAREGGSALRDGQVVRRQSSPDFTMSTMLENGSLVVDGTLTKETIASLNEVIRYADGLSPLIRAGVIFTDTVARTQKQLPTTLIRMTNDTLDEFPGFSREVIGAIYAFSRNKYNTGGPYATKADDTLLGKTDRGLQLAADRLFGAAGSLLASHRSELDVLTTMLEYVLDPLPQALGGGHVARDALTITRRLESAFTGTPEQKTLRLQVVLGQLPAIKSSLDQLGMMSARGGR